MLLWARNADDNTQEVAMSSTSVNLFLNSTFHSSFRFLKSKERATAFRRDKISVSVYHNSAASLTADANIPPLFRALLGHR